MRERNHSVTHTYKCLYLFMCVHTLWWSLTSAETWGMRCWTKTRESPWKCELAESNRSLKREDLARNEQRTKQMLLQHCANAAYLWAQRSCWDAPCCRMSCRLHKGHRPAFPLEPTAKGPRSPTWKRKSGGEGVTWLRKAGVTWIGKSFTAAPKCYV